MSDHADDVVYCGLCPEILTAATITAHHRDAHGVVELPRTWPDGEPVVEDLTLTPEGFL